MLRQVRVRRRAESATLLQANWRAFTVRRFLAHQRMLERIAMAANAAAAEAQAREQRQEVSERVRRGKLPVAGGAVGQMEILRV